MKKSLFFIKIQKYNLKLDNSLSVDSNCDWNQRFNSYNMTYHGYLFLIVNSFHLIIVFSCWDNFKVERVMQALIASCFIDDVI